MPNQNKIGNKYLKFSRTFQQNVVGDPMSKIKAVKFSGFIPSMIFSQVGGSIFQEIT